MLLARSSCSFPSDIFREAFETYRYQMTFAPSQGKLLSAPSKYDIEYKDVLVQTEDGHVLHGWFLPHIRTRSLLIFFHGNGGDLSSYLPIIVQLYNLGFDVLAVDYRGYGQSTGKKASEKGLLLDAKAVLQFALNVLLFEIAQIVVYGYSIGSVPATWIAQKLLLKSLVIHNGFTDPFHVVSNRVGFPFLGSLASETCGFFISTNMTPGKYIEYVQCPVVVIHSLDDTLCPLSEGQNLLRNVSHTNREMDRDARES